MKMFQTAQHEIINISMITNIKPIHNREIGEESERLYTKDEYKRIAGSKDVKKVRVVNQDVLWSQIDVPVVAYKVITTNGSVVISVPDYDRLMKILSSWLTEDAGEDEEEEDVAEEGEYVAVASVEPAVKLTQDIFKSPYCPEWAKWAAIDEDGTVCVYREKPRIANEYFASSTTDLDEDNVGMEQIWHVPGWQRTLIKRED